MVIKNKKMLIEKLTGIHSSKKSYYVELKKKINEITKRNIQLEIINQLAKSIGIDMSFREIIEKVIPKLKTLVYFDLLNLYLVEKEGQISRQVFYAGKESLALENEAPGGESLLGEEQKEQVIKSNSPLWQVITEKKPLLNYNFSPQSCNISAYDELLKEVVKYVIAIPLLVKEKVIGVLEVAGKKEFTGDDLLFLQQVADHLAVCFENARLYNEVWQRKQEWEITFSAVTDLLVFINQNFKIQRVNKAALDFFALGEDEVLGQNCFRLFYGRESKCNPCLAEQVLQTKRTSYLQARTRYNRVLDIFAYPAYTEKNEPYGVTYYAKDVTSFVDSIKFVSLGEMSAGVAHELNSPLTAIVGNSQLLLRETPPTNPHYQLIEDIKSCGMRCQRIIRNLLTFSRQEEFSFEEVNLNQIIERALSLLSYQIEKSKIRLVKKLNPSLPPILGNPQGLEQVVINLLLNAKDAIEEKEETGILEEEGEIVIMTRMQPGQYVAVDVVDNGSGIDPEKIPNIFNPFFTTKKVGKGTGLGLSVSLGIAQAHGGFIDVESIKGHGSTFSLIIPLDKTGEEKSKKDTPFDSAGKKENR